MQFLSFARFHYISALHSTGIGGLLKSVDGAYAAAMSKLPTPKLTRVLMAALAKQQPPRHGVFRPKLRYAHQGGQNPPIVVIHGNALEHVPESYKRFLEHSFMEAFKLQGTPMRVEFRSTSNPFAKGD
jgi:GTP-binding protein